MNIRAISVGLKTLKAVCIKRADYVRLNESKTLRAICIKFKTIHLTIQFILWYMPFHDWEVELAKLAK